MHNLVEPPSRTSADRILGMYLSYEDRGNIAAVIANWPEPHVEITVITDGSRILGLGDLGINGMGIPIGKLALYTACAGIRPEVTLPLTLDLGTSNRAFREDPMYMGSRRDKVSPEEEQDFLDELMAALTERWPGYVGTDLHVASCHRLTRKPDLAS
jgi:malate dehydrogenase (oxaloacetate-decarboxylating)(NADP+)